LGLNFLGYFVRKVAESEGTMPNGELKSWRQNGKDVIGVHFDGERNNEELCSVLNAEELRSELIAKGDGGQK
jgi:hypothetical protein